MHINVNKKRLISYHLRCLMSRPRHRLANQLGKVPSVDGQVPVPHDEFSASDKPSPDNTSGVYVAAKHFRVRQGEVGIAVSGTS